MIDGNGEPAECGAWSGREVNARPISYRRLKQTDGRCDGQFISRVDERRAASERTERRKTAAGNIISNVGAKMRYIRYTGEVRVYYTGAQLYTDLEINPYYSDAAEIKKNK